MCSQQSQATYYHIMIMQYNYHTTDIIAHHYTNPDCIIAIVSCSWDTKSDQRFLSPCTVTATSPTHYQERDTVVVLWNFFNQLGFIATATIKTKLFFPQLWQENVEWDTSLNTGLCIYQMAYYCCYHHRCNNVSLSPYVTASITASENASTNLLVFADASLKAYRSSCLIGTDSYNCRVPS